MFIIQNSLTSVDVDEDFIFYFSSAGCHQTYNAFIMVNGF